MPEHDSRRGRGQGFDPLHDEQPESDTNEWPGEQMRRIDERYRSWRHDRYRRFADEPGDGRDERRGTPLRRSRNHAGP